MFLLKIHRSGDKSIATACDSELLGRSFSSGSLCLDVDANFFGGKDARIDEIICALKSSETANIAGNRIIEELLKRGIILHAGVKKIKGVKYAMIFRL